MSRSLIKILRSVRFLSSSREPLTSLILIIRIRRLEQHSMIGDDESSILCIINVGYIISRL